MFLYLLRASWPTAAMPFALALLPVVALLGEPQNETVPATGRWIQQQSAPVIIVPPVLMELGVDFASATRVD